jgi:hypothetical protein
MKFIKNFSYHSPLHSADFCKGDDAPVLYPEIIAAARAAGVLEKEANGLNDGSKAISPIKLEG